MSEGFERPQVVAAAGAVRGQTGVGAPQLPRAPVLSYLANVTTPTRVRVVAAWGARTVGFLELAPSAALVIWLAYRLWSRWLVIRAWIMPMGWRGYHAMLGNDALILLMLAGMCGVGLALIVLSWPVRRGRRPACIAATIPILLVVYGVVLATVVTACAGLYVGVDFGARVPRPKYEYLMLELLVPIGVLILLLLKDLCGFLRWIGDHPQVESPREPFLPGRGGGRAENDRFR